MQTFEDTVEVEQPAELLEKSMDRQSVYWKALPLPPGLYRLDIAIKDVNNPDHMGIYGRALSVPEFHDEKLATSSLILADQMNPVDSSHSIGSGQLRHRQHVHLPAGQRQSGHTGQFQTRPAAQFLDAGLQSRDRRSDEEQPGPGVYQIVDAANNQVLFEKQLDSKDLGAHSDQMTVEKTLPMAGLQPGKYKVLIKVNDEISKQVIAQSAPFVVQ